MSRSRSDRIVLLVTVLIFCAAIVVLYDQFKTVSLEDIQTALAAMPAHQIFAATGLTCASYLLLTGYDYIALCYVGQRLRLLDVFLTSFIAFAFSNNVGVQLLSGGSTRYRLYSKLGLNSGDILRIVTFCTLAYALGVIAIGGFVFLLEPDVIAASLHLGHPLIIALGAALLALVMGYLVVAAIWRGTFVIWRFRLRPPSLDLAIAQVALASVDAVLASTVFYVLLPADFNLGFPSYLGIYLIAATISVLSSVPGGLGVFETAITLMTVPPSKAATLSALLAYRLIYFFIPFVIAIVLFALREMRSKDQTRSG